MGGGFGEVVVEWQWWIYGFGCYMCGGLSMSLESLLGGVVAL